MRRLAFILGLIFSCSIAFSQAIHESTVWVSGNLKFNLGDGLDGKFMSQYRHFADRDDVYHILLGVGINKKVNDNLTIGGGFATLSINQFIDTDMVLVPELRPYQEIEFFIPFENSKVSFRGMVEERFFRRAADGELIEGTDFNFRYRKRIQYVQNVSDKFQLVLSSETFFQSGRSAVNRFDQHRGIIQGVLKLKPLSISTGYMNWAFYNPAGITENRHTWLIGFSKTL